MVKDYIFVTCEKRINEGIARKKEFLKHVDQDAVKELNKAQVEVVGGNETIFKVLDKNVKSGVIEVSLLREFCDLYRWRRNFFDDRLPVLKGAWFTDNFCRDVIIHQITKNFDEIVNLVCSKVLKAGEHPTDLFFSCDSSVESCARSRRMDNVQILFHLKESILWRGYFLTDKFLPGAYLRFGDIAHILVEHYRVGVKKLEEIALKSAFSNEIDLSCVPNIVKKNSRISLYYLDGEIPDNLSEEGKSLFDQLLNVFKNVEQ